MNIFINLSVIFWSLFPALMSYTQPASSPLKVELRQLVSNSDLLIDSDSDGLPDGFRYSATDISLTNGIAKFTATVQYEQFYTPSAQTNIGDMIYFYGRVKVSGPSVRAFTVNPTVSVYHTGSGNWELLSGISVRTNTSLIVYASDNRSSLWTPIEVDYIGAINITDLVSKGCLPAGLSDAEYKTLIDMIISEIGGTFQGSYFYTETIADNYKWFSTGFVEKTGERDFVDYLGFFVWLVVPYLFAFLVYKLLKGVIYG